MQKVAGGIWRLWVPWLLVHGVLVLYFGSFINCTTCSLP